MSSSDYSNIQIDSWKRKEYYEFYSGFDQPFFGIDAQIKCTKAVTYCKEENISFFMYYMYKAFLALNEIAEFKTRIVDDEVRQYETIHVGTTIGRLDESFAFAFCEFQEDFTQFAQQFSEEIERVNQTTGLRLNANTRRADLMHCSSIPWISFTGIHHARHSGFKDSIPKLTFGKYFEKDGELHLPISVHAHHGLMDGIHVAKFFKQLESLLNT